MARFRVYARQTSTHEARVVVEAATELAALSKVNALIREERAGNWRWEQAEGNIFAESAEELDDDEGFDAQDDMEE